jgi:mannose-6-phosphate isomerase-like protein (cupin superfamily)
MGVFRSREDPPAWCQLRAFWLIDVERDPTEILAKGRTRRVLATRGRSQVTWQGGSVVLGEAQFVDLPADARAVVSAPAAGAQIVVFSGDWGSEVGGCGIFRVTPSSPKFVEGDPVNYPKFTNFDSHYHDCDEYWVILEGEGTVVVGQNRHEVKQGDCIPIGMGHRHDLPEVRSDVRGAFFETTLERQKRIGHLWEHTHGPAVPAPERV